MTGAEEHVEAFELAPLPRFVLAELLGDNGRELGQKGGAQAAFQGQRGAAKDDIGHGHGHLVVNEEGNLAVGEVRGLGKPPVGSGGAEGSYPLRPGAIALEQGGGAFGVAAMLAEGGP